MNPMGGFSPEMAKRARAKRKPLVRVLRPSLRVAVLEAHRITTDLDTMGEAPVDFVRRHIASASVRLFVVGEAIPITVFGFTDEHY